MPNIHGVGYNHRSTLRKQFALDGALGHLLGSSVSVARKRGLPCFVCDMTCGPGRDPNGREGSPLILARHLHDWDARGDHIRLLCVDREKTYLDEVRALLPECYPGLEVEYFSDQATAIERIPLGAVGLTYWDPTRYNDLDRTLLARFGRSHQLMDILITRECLAGYRMLRAPHVHDTLTIQEYLALTGKRCNYLMQYADWGWWSFGFADNWTDRPANKLRGFYNLRSPDARQVWAKWTLDPPPGDDEDPPTWQGALL